MQSRVRSQVPFSHQDMLSKNCTFILIKIECLICSLMFCHLTLSGWFWNTIRWALGPERNLFFLALFFLNLFLSVLKLLLHLFCFLSYIFHFQITHRTSHTENLLSFSLFFIALLVESYHSITQFNLIYFWFTGRKLASNVWLF